jgi:hypothetical protein
MPHHLEIDSSGQVHLDYEGIESDSATIAFSGDFDSQIEQRRRQASLMLLNSEAENPMKSRQESICTCFLPWHGHPSTLEPPTHWTALPARR